MVGYHAAMRTKRYLQDLRCRLQASHDACHLSFPSGLKSNLIHLSPIRKAVVKLLVERDNVEVDSRDNYGQTPLSMAAGSGHEAIVKLLVERNDVEAASKDNYDQTPLSMAAGSGHEAIVKLLVERNDVEVDSMDNYGRTPLSLAAGSGHEAIEKLLLVERDDFMVESKEKNVSMPLCCRKL